ncbi:MAG: rubredoxin-type Fe(Cys)4 protein [Desulfobulbus sp.]|nr:rubredoxin-type Fe(Cys)4 protein [Desulfobulbus sp.]
MRKWECTVCGYVHEGDEPPDECPICSADKSMFVEIFEEEQPPQEQPVAEKPAPLTPAPPIVEPSLLTKLFTFASEQILRHHLHPITVHTPNGVLPMALIFLLITAFLGLPIFETAAFYSFIFVLLTMPVVIFTGYTVWQKRYRKAMTSTFKIKIGASIVTVTLLCVLILWRAVQPEILTAASTGRWIFILLSLILVGTVGLAGHVGGKLVFGSRNQ